MISLDWRIRINPPSRNQTFQTRLILPLSGREHPLFIHRKAIPVVLGTVEIFIIIKSGRWSESINSGRRLPVHWFVLRFIVFVGGGGESWKTEYGVRTLSLSGYSGRMMCVRRLDGTWRGRPGEVDRFNWACADWSRDFEGGECVNE